MVATSTWRFRSCRDVTVNVTIAAGTVARTPLESTVLVVVVAVLSTHVSAWFLGRERKNPTLWLFRQFRL